MSDKGETEEPPGAISAFQEAARLRLVAAVTAVQACRKIAARALDSE